MILLRPDPLLTARAIAEDAPTDGTRAAAQRLDLGSLRLAAVAMILGQIVMVAIMTMTPIHMRDHGHSLGAAGFVISMHIAAMYLPSLVTGTLVDRIGRKPVLAFGASTLLAAGLVAALAPADSLTLLTLALVLLGLGWNLGLVAGSALVTDAVPLAARANTQGKVDLGVSLSGASGAISSGFVVAAASYAALSIAGGILALALLPFLVLSRSRAATSS
jgi:MFS family permease